VVEVGCYVFFVDAHKIKKWWEGDIYASVPHSEHCRQTVSADSLLTVVADYRQTLFRVQTSH
jgi:hypothetical protein